MLCLYQNKKRAPKSNEVNSNVKGPLWEQWKELVHRIKIMYEGQLVDPVLICINNECRVFSIISEWTNYELNWADLGIHNNFYNCKLYNRVQNIGNRPMFSIV